MQIMNFFYVYLGFAITLILLALSTRPRIPTLLRILLGIFGGTLFVSAYFLSPATLGSDIWYDRDPWKEVITFAVMILGMVCRTLSQAIEQRRVLTVADKSSHPIGIDKWDMIYPFLVSFITFGGLLSQIREQTMGLTMLVFAFQNGFFWQTLIGRLESTKPA
jgi:hypothetical protein